MKRLVTGSFLQSKDSSWPSQNMCSLRHYYPANTFRDLLRRSWCPILVGQPPFGTPTTKRPGRHLRGLSVEECAESLVGKRQFQSTSKVLALSKAVARVLISLRSSLGVTALAPLRLMNQSTNISRRFTEYRTSQTSVPALSTWL